MAVLLLGEEVSVGAAVLHCDAVALATHAVARHCDRTLVVGQRGVLQDGHVPQKGVGRLLRLTMRVWVDKKKKQNLDNHDPSNGASLQQSLPPDFKTTSQSETVRTMTIEHFIIYSNL